METIFLRQYFAQNGGPGSGNFAPGQGRGVGKPGIGRNSGESSRTVKKIEVMFDVPDKYEKAVKSYMSSPKYKEKYQKLLDAKNKEIEAKEKSKQAQETFKKEKKELKEEHPDSLISKTYLDKIEAIKEKRTKAIRDANKAIEERKTAEKEFAIDAAKEISKGKSSLTATIGRASTEDSIIIFIKENSTKELDI